ncbi:MAG: FAD-binding protein [Pseudomonadota bacterium]
MLAPQSEAELADIVKSSSQPFAVQGGGTRGIETSGALLSTSGLQGITLYEPGALTLVARSGTPVSEVEAILAKENQRLAFEPMDHRSLMGTTGVPTIGGVVAGNISGPRRIMAGACRDSLIGVRFVDGTGTVIKNGGRVMKNVTGYDLVKLMAGSFGTLGILSEVSFKVLPGVADVKTLVFGGLSVAQAIEAMSLGLGSPFEVSGAAHDPARQETSLRLEGFEASVAYRAKALSELLVQFGQAQILDHESAAYWDNVANVTDFATQTGDVWRISVKPSDAPRVSAALPGIALRYDWGGGLIWALCAPGQDLRPPLDGIAGHATRVRGAPGIAMFQPEPASIAALAQGLRARFDPRAILNSGLMGASHANDIHA